MKSYQGIGPLNFAVISVEENITKRTEGTNKNANNAIRHFITTKKELFVLMNVT